MKVVYYWSPCLTPVGTVKSTLNSAISLSKYNNDFDVKILNVFGEWNEHKKFLEKNGIELINLNSFSYKKFLPRYGFIGSRFSYIVIMLFSFFPLLKLLKKNKPDYLIIHLLTFIPLILFNLFKFQSKLILRISGYPKLNFLRKFFWKKSSNFIYKITCPSKELLSDLKSLNVFYNNDLSLLYDAIISLEEYRQKKNDKKFVPEKQINENFFLTVGRLTKQKNYFYLINEFAKFCKKNPKEKLVIIGDGELKQNINTQIKRLNLSKNIELISYSNNVYHYMRKSKCLILPSLWEEIGFVIVEAALSNTNVISSDCKNGTKEFLLFGDGGFLFKNNKLDALFNSLSDFVITEKKILTKKKILAKKNSKNFSMFYHQLALRKILF